MANTTVDPSGNPIPTSSVLMAASKHIAVKCSAENMAFIKCKKKDPNPEKCLDKGREVTEVEEDLCGHFKEFICNPLGVSLSIQLVRYYGVQTYPKILELKRIKKYRLKTLQRRCPREMDAYAGCLYYYTNEFDLCRKEQEIFEKACPLAD